MRRDEVQQIFERVETQLRAAEDARRLALPSVRRLEREYATINAKMAPLKKQRTVIEEKAKRLGLSFRAYQHGDRPVGSLEIDNRRSTISPARKRFTMLKDQWRIATLGSTPDDIKQQQAVLRDVAKLAEANQ